MSLKDAYHRGQRDVRKEVADRTRKKEAEKKKIDATLEQKFGKFAYAAGRLAERMRPVAAAARKGLKAVKKAKGKKRRSEASLMKSMGY